MPAELAAALARARDRLGCLASDIIFFPTVGSTNDVAAGRSPERLALREGVVVIADRQTAGRGRRGHTWFSPPGSGLYVSVVLAPSRACDPRRATTLLTLAASVALAQAVEAYTGLGVALKWPNDLHIGSRKFGGILAEAQVDQHSGGGGVPAARKESGAPREIENVVLGYGVNVGTAAYPPDVRDRATSLETELGRPVDRHGLLVETLASLAARYEDLLAGRFDVILDAWRQRAPGASGARVTWTTPEGPRTGMTAGIDDDGALLVRVGHRLERIVAGELEWL